MLTDTIRKMASIQHISSLEPIENSDFLEVAMMKDLGWKVVVKKGEFKVGDTVIYFEIDSAINVKDLVAPLEFLKDKGTKKLFTGRTPDTSTFSEEYVRIKTIKLRGQISQGLILPLEAINSIPFDNFAGEDGSHSCLTFDGGEDMTQYFRVEVWDRLVEWFADRTQLGPKAQFHSGGDFPSDVPKTDEIRCLDGNTKVLLNDGEYTIKDTISQLKAGKCLSIKSFNEKLQKDEFQPITGYTVSPASDMWLKITLEDGTVIKCTNNHRIFLPLVQGYRLASELTVGDMVQKLTKCD